MSLLWAAALLASVSRAAEPRVLFREEPGPLVSIRIMARAGSALDPEGREGLAQLAGRLLVEGGFGDPAAPLTKEALAELTRPWGAAAYPAVAVTKEAAVFAMRVPAEALDEYLARVLGPMLTRPLFAAEDLERARREALQGLRSGLRLERIEHLGLAALDNVIHAGTGYAHPDGGTERGLKALTREDLLRFYRTYYGPGSLVAAVGASEPGVARRVAAALKAAGPGAAAPLPRREAAAPRPPAGPSALIVAQPNAIATGLHAGFAIAVTRADPDYWPLLVANTWFGAHRDGFGRLFQALREQRGYNYGDYSYIEHFEGRPDLLFPPPNAPRRHQYFSVWIRPLQHEYAAHALKAASWELERLARAGLGEEDCAAAKKKARVLYLSLAETSERLLAERLDDEFYGLKPGYLEGYLDRVAAVRCDEVNAALRRHLGGRALSVVAVTDDEAAPALAEALVSTAPAWGKPPEAYQLDAREEDGRKVYAVPADKLDLLRLDAVWAHHPLGLGREAVRVVPVEKLFETAAIP